MDKEINPVLALVIIVMLLIPLGFRFWAGGEHAGSRVSNFYLEEDAVGRLSLQVDNQLIFNAQTNTDEEQIDLGELGVSELRGNVAYFSNNDVLVRVGNSQAGLSSLFSFAEFEDSEQEKKREKLVNGRQSQAGFYRCSLSGSSCESLQNLEAAWNYKTFIDDESDEIYLSSGTDHILSKYDQKGNLTAKKAGDFKFPKRIREHGGELYVSDTNNHRVVFIDHKNNDFGRTIQSHPSSTNENQTASWTLDAVFLNDSWWVLNAGDGMENSKLMRFDQNWDYKNTIALPDKAEPADLLVRDSNLLVSDRSLGVIYQFDGVGNKLAEITSPSVKGYFAMMDNKRAYYSNLMMLCNIILLVMVVGGGIAAVWYSKQ